METKHREQQVYPAVLAGVLTIDSEGRIWRGARRAEHSIGKYLQVRVMRDSIRYHALAHRLVWLHSRGPIPGVLHLNHRNGDGTDNRLENLELATASENAIHAHRTLHKGRNQFGEFNSMSKLTAVQVRAIRHRRNQLGEPLKQIANDYGVSDRTVSKIALGQRWTGA